MGILFMWCFIVYDMRSLKKYLFVAFVILLQNISSAQKNDYLWQFGYNTSWEHPGAEAFNLCFDTFPPRIELDERNMYFLNGYANICDVSGGKLFTTENCRVINRTGETIINGDSMMQGWELDWCNNYGYHPYEFYSAFLPAPGYINRIFYFNKSTYKSNTPPLEIYTNKFRYSTIEILDNGENGEVIEKDKVLINDKIGYAQISSVKHGNGRDWWLPVPVRIGNKIHMVLLGKDTVYVHHAQNLGPAWGEDGGFQANFSLDGSKYVRYNRFYGVYIYDFNRCDGTLSNLIHFDFNDTTQGIFGGCAISPNNRWLYLADFDYLYQFDLQENDILASKLLIDIWDGSSNLLPTKFSYIILGPDKRLYVFPPTTTKNMHVINRPDLAGDDSDFRQRELEFPYHYQNTPVFPNFRLGPLDDSPCDTLGIDNHPLADFRPDPTDSNALALRLWDVSSYEPAEWLWNFGDGSPASQDTSPVHTFPAPGFYTVCLTLGNQYGVSSKCKVVELKTVGNSTPEDLAAPVLIFPNPANETLQINLTEAVDGIIRVLDLTGRVWHSGTRVQGQKNIEINTSGLPSGVYIVQFQSVSGGVSSQKLMVQH